MPKQKFKNDMLNIVKDVKYKHFLKVKRKNIFKIDKDDFIFIMSGCGFLVDNEGELYYPFFQYESINLFGDTHSMFANEEVSLLKIKKFYLPKEVFDLQKDIVVYNSFVYRQVIALLNAYNQNAKDKVLSFFDLAIQLNNMNSYYCHLAHLGGFLGMTRECAGKTIKQLKDEEYITQESDILGSAKRYFLNKEKITEYVLLYKDKNKKKIIQKNKKCLNNLKPKKHRKRRRKVWYSDINGHYKLTITVNKETIYLGTYSASEKAEAQSVLDTAVAMREAGASVDEIKKLKKAKKARKKKEPKLLFSSGKNAYFVSLPFDEKPLLIDIYKATEKNQAQEVLDKAIAMRDAGASREEIKTALKRPKSNAIKKKPKLKKVGNRYVVSFSIKNKLTKKFDVVYLGRFKLDEKEKAQAIINKAYDMILQGCSNSEIEEKLKVRRYKVKNK